jgi:hypothetical protein
MTRCLTPSISHMVPTAIELTEAGAESARSVATAVVRGAGTVPIDLSETTDPGVRSDPGAIE